jgi:hypothetical protein
LTPYIGPVGHPLTTDQRTKEKEQNNNTLSYKSLALQLGEEQKREKNKRRPRESF